MKTKDQLYQRESVIPRPRVVLKSEFAKWFTRLVQEARSSSESQQDAERHRETRSNTADCQIPGITIPTVKLHGAQRQNNVTKLIEIFEKHQNEEQFLTDMSEKQESQKITRRYMNQTEIFDIC